MKNQTNARILPGYEGISLPNSPLIEPNIDRSDYTRKSKRLSSLTNLNTLAIINEMSPARPSVDDRNIFNISGSTMSTRVSIDSKTVDQEINRKQDNRNSASEYSGGSSISEGRQISPKSLLSYNSDVADLDNTADFVSAIYEKLSNSNEISNENSVSTPTDLSRSNSPVQNYYKADGIENSAFEPDFVSQPENLVHSKNSEEHEQLVSDDSFDKTLVDSVKQNVTEILAFNSEIDKLFNESEMKSRKSAHVTSSNLISYTRKSEIEESEIESEHVNPSNLMSYTRKSEIEESIIRKLEFSAANKVSKSNQIRSISPTDRFFRDKIQRGSSLIEPPLESVSSEKIHQDFPDSELKGAPVRPLVFTFEKQHVEGFNVDNLLSSESRQETLATEEDSSYV
jgi:hypothetical protein